VRIDVTTWSLEMLDRAQLKPAPRPQLDLLLLEAELPSPELGRFLYTAVGGDWYWIDRLGWTYAQWEERLADPRVETWVAYFRGTPAGYFELDLQDEGSLEIAYFGLLPGLVGKGLGGWLLTAAIERGWELGARRVWVHTCSLDGPNALANYQARGMKVFKEESAPQELPDKPPGPWPGARLDDAPHLPPPERRGEESS
jgi:GNAT superfamily N-acetyltransferase